MFSNATRLLGACILCTAALASPSLNAQQRTYDMDVATITFVNAELYDNCQRTIGYRNLLQGVYNTDPNEPEPTDETFIITVADSDPSNGPVIDGCGTFDFTIRPNPDSMVTGFIFGSGQITTFDAIDPMLVAPVSPTNKILLTTQLDDITVNSLPFTVPRSYEVTGSTGMPIMTPSNLDLLMRLTEGGDLPRFTDNCSDVTVTVTDAINVTDPCGDIIITRTFTAEESSQACTFGGMTPNNQVSVSYDITLVRPRGSAVQAPAPLANFDCDDPSVTPGQFPQPSTMDFPVYPGPDGPIFLDGIFGNVGASFSDSPAVQVCANTYKFVRTWTVIDWCAVDSVRTFTQLVKVGDTRPPTITVPTQDLDMDGIPDAGPLLFSTNTADCRAIFDVNFGGVGTQDACSSTVELEAFIFPGGDTTNRLGPIPVDATNPLDRLTPALPLGDHIIRYVATDDCGNSSFTDLDIRVEDLAGPTVIIEDALNVSLSNSGFAVINAVQFDEGSSDQCGGNIFFEIVFANPANPMMPLGAYGPSLTLTCIDVGAVPVIIRVTDDMGNTNTRSSIINVVDDSPPICVAPGSLSVDCNAPGNTLPTDFSTLVLNDPDSASVILTNLFGAPTSLDNCGNEVTTEAIDDQLNSCGSGTITRDFSISDARGMQSIGNCRQIVTIRPSNDYLIELPGDQTLDCGSLAIADPTVQAFGCDLIMVDFDETQSFNVSAACYQITRRYTITNMCEYDGTSPALVIDRDADGDGNLRESTFLRVVVDGTSATAVLDDDASAANGDLGDVTANYAGAAGAGRFAYTQLINVNDRMRPTFDNVMTVVSDGSSCTDGVLEAGFTVSDNCTDADELVTTLTLDFNHIAGAYLADRSLVANEFTEFDGQFTVRTTDLPLGDHALQIITTDQCGNPAVRTLPFSVEASGSGTVSPICIGDITAVLVPDGNGGGIAVVNSASIVVDASGVCGSQEVEYSIYRSVGQVDQPGFMPMVGDEELFVTCDDIGISLVQVFAIPDVGTGTACEIRLEVLADGPNVCPTGNLGSVAGFITTPQNELLTGIEVRISDMAAMNDMMHTDANGSFLFTGLQNGNQYMVSPAADQSVDLTRVRTSDIFRITSHILGDNVLTQPNQLIAADVVADGYINVLDMVAIRRVILGLDPTFQDGPTWRFIRRDHDLTGLAEGWDYADFPSDFMINDLQGNNRDGDFTAIQIGDVNFDAIPREQRGLFTTDRTLAAGETAEVELTAGAFAALQGTITATNGLAIEAWHSEILGAGHVNDAALFGGDLAFSYDGREPLAGQTLLTLTVRAETDLQLSDALRISNRITRPEAVTAAGRALGLDLRFDGQTAGLTLGQNFPNPVGDRTTVTFELPTDAAVIFDIHDVQGRLLSRRELDGRRGRNVLQLERATDFPGASGLLTYTLRAGDRRVSKRMTVVSR